MTLLARHRSANTTNGADSHRMRIEAGLHATSIGSHTHGTAHRQHMWVGIACHIMTVQQLEAWEADMRRTDIA